MPLSINVGLSRKASKDYQSLGVSINVTAELDQALLARPVELQQQIGDLYAQAQRAMELQVGQMAASDYSHPRRPSSNGNGQARANGNGEQHAAAPRRANGNGSSATDSQRRAIAAIARSVGVDPAVEAQQSLARAGESPELDRRARTHAERVLTQFLGSLGWRVSVRWSDRGAHGPVPGCVAQPGAGWPMPEPRSSRSSSGAVRAGPREIPRRTGDPGCVKQPEENGRRTSGPTNRSLFFSSD